MGLGYDRMDKDEDKGSLRAVAFCAVVFSTVAVTACLITFPLVFHYVQTLQATVQGEVHYCKVTHSVCSFICPYNLQLFIISISNCNIKLFSKRSKNK